MTIKSVSRGDANFDVSVDARVLKMVYDPAIDPSDGYEVVRFAPDKKEEQKWRSLLEREKHVALYGAEGAGKTARRIRTQATCQTYRGLGILPVFYFLPASLLKAHSWLNHCGFIARSIAYELFTFFCEKGDFTKLSPKQQGFVLDLLRFGYGEPLWGDCLCVPIPSFRDLDLDFRYGEGSVNPEVTRRYKELTAKLNDAPPKSTSDTPRDLLECTWRALQSAGFYRAFLFIDNLDIPLRLTVEPELSASSLRDVLLPIFKNVKELGKSHIYLKAFLPIDIIDSGLRSYLGSECLSATPVETGKPLVLCEIRIEEPRRPVTTQEPIPRKGYKELNDSGGLITSKERVKDIVRFVCGLEKSEGTLLQGRRFIVVKGGAGVGKTVLLEELHATLGSRLLAEQECRVKARITKIINIKAILDDTSGALLRSEMAVCADADLAGATLAEMAVAMQTNLRSPDKLGITVVVLVDDLETLNNPLVDSLDLDRSARVRDVKNHLLRPLLTMRDVPVVVVAAARSMPEEPLTCLPETVFQDALSEIVIVDQDVEVARVLGTGATPAMVLDCADSLLVADRRRPATWNTDARVRRELVDEILAREPAAQGLWFERLLTVLSKSTSSINASVIQDEAKRLGLPDVLQDRIVARLLASGHLENRGDRFRVYAPLANLLCQLPSA